MKKEDERGKKRKENLLRAKSFAVVFLT